MCDSECCDGPLGDTQYSVRQIVALYRVDYEKVVKSIYRNSSADAEKQTWTSKYCDTMGRYQMSRKSHPVFPTTKTTYPPMVCLRPTLPLTLV
jgi:hypothetical protein